MSDIAAQHERVIGRLGLCVLVSDKGQERNGGQFHLLIGHFVEFRDLDDNGVLELLKVGSMRRLIPLEEIGIVDEVLDQEIFRVGGERRSFLDLVQRSDRRAEDMEHYKGDLPLLDRFEKADIAQSVQRRRHQSGADIDDGYGRVGGRQRVDDAHLIGDSGGVDHFADVAMKAFKRSFGVSVSNARVGTLCAVKQSSKVRATVVLPTPPLSAPTRISAGLAMVPPSQQNYSCLHPQLIVTQPWESWKV